MRQKLALAVMMSFFAGALSLTVPVSAETPAVGQMKQQTAPKRAGIPKPAQQQEKPGFKVEIKKNGPGGFSVRPPVQHKCMPGYSKTHEHINHNGAMDSMKCLSPIFECPHKSKVKSGSGTPASGQGIDIKKVPVGAVGDSNRFRIEYRCTYYWPEG